MPLTYSIAYGLIAGICCYAIMSATYRLLEFVGIERPVFEAPVEDDPIDEIIKKDEQEEAAAQPNAGTSSDKEPAPVMQEAEA